MESGLEIDLQILIDGVLKDAKLSQLGPDSFQLYAGKSFLGSVFKRQGTWILPENLNNEQRTIIVQTIENALALNRISIHFTAYYADEHRPVYIYQQYRDWKFDVHMTISNVTRLVGTLLRTSQGWQQEPWDAGGIKFSTEEIQQLVEIIESRLNKDEE